MSTRLYKINGEYNTFEYWHDHYGYTRTPTFSVQYKTTNPWGAAFASDGYYDAEDLMDIFTFSFFVPGVVGWYNIDDLALVGYYPAAAADLTVYREGVASNAASLAGDDGTYYLVERDINQGWMTEEEMFARGWEFITIDYTYLLIDETTGNSVLENFEQDFVVEPIAESIIPDDDFVVTPLTEFPVTTFYLNSEGNKATTDHYLTMTGNPVFDLDGNNILYNNYKDIQGVMPAYFSRVDNTFFMGQSGDTFVDWSEGKAGIGAVASRGKEAWSVSFERRDGVIDVYVKTNSTYPTKFMYQSKVTSTSTAAAEAGSLNEIYLDSAFTQPLQIDPNMDYELGSMVNQEWTPNAIQTKEDMPSSTTSSTSTKVSAELLTESNGNFLIWFVTNYTSTSSISAPNGYAIRKLRVTPKPDDSATGTISTLTLPTAHSGSYTNVTFDTLRYYVKGTTQWLNNTTGAFFGTTLRTWYYGTIVWTDESLGDLSSLIQVNPTSSNHLVQQTVFRIIFITGGVTGYHAYDTSDSSEILNQITAYSYNNGEHSITFYSPQSWWGYTGTGRIQFRYLDGTTTFNGLDAYDLILVNNGVLSKATTTDRYDMYNTYNGDITIHAEY